MFRATITQFIGFDALVLSLGPLSAGYAWSNYSGGGDWGQTYNIFAAGYTGATHNQFVQLSWASNGIGAWIAAESLSVARVPRDASGPAS